MSLFLEPSWTEGITFIQYTQMGFLVVLESRAADEVKTSSASLPSWLRCPLFSSSPFLGPSSADPLRFSLKLALLPPAPLLVHEEVSERSVLVPCDAAVQHSALVSRPVMKPHAGA